MTPVTGETFLQSYWQRRYGDVMMSLRTMLSFQFIENLLKICFIEFLRAVVLYMFVGQGDQAMVTEHFQVIIRLWPEPI